jgi:hypothetical protein
MRCPPLLLCLGVGKGRFPIWLPLFLLWPVAAALIIVLVPLVLLAALILRHLVWGKLILRSGPLFFNVFCALRGLEVNLDRGDRLLLISFK